jgi:hypothetical protein
MSDPVSWRIHIGAHKTGTTHLQDFLSQHRDALGAAGVDFLPRPSVRAAQIRRCFKPKRSSWFPPLFSRRRTLSETLGPLRAGPATVVVSEESLIGKYYGLYQSPIYPDLEKRLSLIARDLGRERLRLFVSIRDYSELLPSVYSQCLRQGKRMPVFDEFRNQLVNNPPNWHEFIARIRDTVPGVPLTVWTHEDYIVFNREIMSHFCGTAVPEGEMIPAPKQTRRLSASTVMAIEALDPSLSKQEYEVEVKKLCDADDGSHKHDPFDSTEKAQLSNLYLKHLQQIRSSFPDVLLSFDSEKARRSGFANTGESRSG